MDPQEDLVIAGMFGWVSGPALKVVEEYLTSVKKYPNPLHPALRSSGQVADRSLYKKKVHSAPCF